MAKRVIRIVSMKHRRRPEEVVFSKVLDAVGGPTVTKVLAFLVAATPLIGAYLYLAGLVGYTEFLNHFELPTGVFRLGLQETLVYGYLATTGGLTQLPAALKAALVNLAIFSLLYYVIKAIDEHEKKTSIPQFFQDHPRLGAFLEAVVAWLIAAIAFIVTGMALVVVAILLPVFGGFGGQADARYKDEQLSKPCSSMDRCLEISSEGGVLRGRLIASSPTHLALLIPVSGDVAILTLEGSHVAWSRGSGVVTAEESDEHIDPLD